MSITRSGGFPVALPTLLPRAQDQAVARTAGTGWIAGLVLLELVSAVMPSGREGAGRTG